MTTGNTQITPAQVESLVELAGRIRPIGCNFQQSVDGCAIWEIWLGSSHYSSLTNNEAYYLLMGYLERVTDEQIKLAELRARARNVRDRIADLSK